MFRSPLVCACAYAHAAVARTRSVPACSSTSPPASSAKASGDQPTRSSLSSCCCCCCCGGCCGCAAAVPLSLAATGGLSSSACVGHVAGSCRQSCARSKQPRERMTDGTITAYPNQAKVITTREPSCHAALIRLSLPPWCPFPPANRLEGLGELGRCQDTRTPRGRLRGGPQASQQGRRRKEGCMSQQGSRVCATPPHPPTQSRHGGRKGVPRTSR